MKNLNVNFDKMNIIIGAGLALAITTATAAVGVAISLNKEKCDIKEKHAHLYKSKTGYVRFIEKEYKNYEGYERDNEYILLNEEEQKLRKYEDKKDLLRIEENKDLISNIQEENKDFIEYRYKYTFNQPIPHYMHVGKMTTVYYTYIPTTHYSWTKDSNHSRLTGEQRKCHYVYQAYKIEVDEKGKNVLIPSDYVDDLFSIQNEYPYIKENFYKVVEAERGNDLDYEDGKEETIDIEEQALLNNTKIEEKSKVKTLSKI